jgi:nucleoside phosphorylase
MNKTIIIAALSEELHVLEHQFETKHVEWNDYAYEVGEKYIFVLSGVGNINSAMSAEAAISFCYANNFEIDEVLNFGLAGVFDNLPVGTYLPIKTVTHYDFDTSTLHEGEDEIRRYELNGGEFVCTSGDKFLDNRPKYSEEATACDMELAGVAAVCTFHNIKLRSIKIVSDKVGGDDQVEEFISSKQKLESIDINGLITAFGL